MTRPNLPMHEDSQRRRQVCGFLPKKHSGTESNRLRGIERQGVYGRLVSVEVLTFAANDRERRVAGLRDEQLACVVSSSLTQAGRR